jgi:hypothetical protein
VDLTRGRALAQALGEHTSNKPLFGFAKRRRVRDPRVQLALNMALTEHVEDRNEKSINLCLWAGAEPHSPAPNLRHAIREDDLDDDEDSEPSGLSAVWIACIHGDSTIVALLGPDPNRDEFDPLYSAAGRPQPSNCSRSDNSPTAWAVSSCHNFRSLVSIVPLEHPVGRAGQLRGVCSLGSGFRRRNRVPAATPPPNPGVRVHRCHEAPGDPGLLLVGCPA